MDRSIAPYSAKQPKEENGIKLMTLTKRIQTILHKDVTYFMLANILFSVSSMIVNVSLPKVLERNFFDEFIYIFQMVFFLTNISQIGIILGLYRYIQQAREEVLCIYYLTIFFVNVILFALGVWQNNPLTIALKLESLTALEQFTFYASVATSGIFLYNKGKNVADKAYRYMIRISITAFILRMVAIGLLWQLKISETTQCLVLLFIMPFIQDIWDYVSNSFKYVQVCLISKRHVQIFFTYCLKIWLVASMFNIADRIFIIHTKGLSTHFTTALAFSAGLIGIITLFNNSFYNYFISNMHESNLSAIKQHIKRLNKIAPLYMITLLLLCLVISFCILIVYPELGRLTSIISFIVLFRTGLISYIGMYSLLSKVLNILNIEIALGLLRIAIVWILCTCWQPSNMILWYTTITFIIPFPEIILSLVVKIELNRRIRRETGNK